MDSTIAVALISLAGTLGGSFAGIMVANKLVNYRLEQLGKKVEKHNNLIDRMYKIEKHHEVLDTRVKDLSVRVNELEDCA